jgi:hypothetical protein
MPAAAKDGILLPGKWRQVSHEWPKILRLFIVSTVLSKCSFVLVELTI